MNMMIIDEWEYKKYFEYIDVFYLTAPFGIYKSFVPKQEVKTITTCSKKWDGLNCEAFKQTLFKIKINNQIHIKLAIGNLGALYGSWNFCEPNNQELVLFCEPREPIYEKLKTFFEKRWDKSGEVEE